MVSRVVRLATATLAIVACNRASSTAPTDATDHDQAPPASAEPEPEPGPDDPTAARPDPGPRPLHVVYRSELRRALAGGPGHLLGELGPEPYRLSGHFVGWQITRLFPDDPELCASGCGIAVGDVILGVNGNRLETPQAFAAMVEQLPRLTTLEVHSLRDDRRREVIYRIVEDVPH